MYRFDTAHLGAMATPAAAIQFRASVQAQGMSELGRQPLLEPMVVRGVPGATVEAGPLAPEAVAAPAPPPPVGGARGSWIILVLVALAVYALFT